MVEKFNVRALIRSRDRDKIRPVVERLFAGGRVSISAERKDEIAAEAVLSGTSARDVNRSILSELRRFEKRTTMRSEWTYGSSTESYFDYVLKKKARP